MLLSRRQPINRANYFLSGEARRLFHSHPFNHFSEHRTAYERRRAAIGQKACCRYASIAQSQRETQAITAHGIRLFRYSRCVRKLTGAARVREMIFKRV